MPIPLLQAALRDDLHSVHARLTGEAMADSSLQVWQESKGAELKRAADAIAATLAALRHAG